MNIILHKKTKSNIYKSFTLIELSVINTFQVFSINVILFNKSIQFLHEKEQRRTATNRETEVSENLQDTWG